MLYEIIPNSPCSSFDPKVKPGPHADGIVGCASKKPVGSVAKQVAQLSTNQSASGQATASSQPTQTVNVHALQASDQKGNQQPRWNRKKGKNNNNKKGGYKNENANNNDKKNKNVGGTSRLNVRLNFLASYVRMITSLTCSLGWMKIRSS